MKTAKAHAQLSSRPSPLARAGTQEIKTWTDHHAQRRGAALHWVPGLARIMGVKAPRHVPLWLAKLAAGTMAVGAVSMRGADNAKARAELGWAPARPTWREGFAEVFG